MQLILNSHVHACEFVALTLCYEAFSFDFSFDFFQPVASNPHDPPFPYLFYFKKKP
jgi:hypothetical protein